MIPLAADWTRIDETILRQRHCLAMSFVGSSAEDLPGLVTSVNITETGMMARVRSCRGHDGSFYDNAGIYVFPKRNQQLARERNDRRLFLPATVLHNTRFEP
jgi:hypothetical protein